ncbi:hypothetical protein [Leptospira santarosai]|uniref:hypothetical protein n=2 Tax=Leptospira santarosai TaxID=28183 RepID=UPI002E2F5B18|nr:hypothetical protein [Leptospira santarosai]
MITLWTVIEHLLYPEEALSFIKKRLNSGYLLLEFPCADSLMMDLYGKHYFWIMPRIISIYFRKKDCVVCSKELELDLKSYTLMECLQIGIFLKRLPNLRQCQRNY